MMLTFLVHGDGPYARSAHSTAYIPDLHCFGAESQNGSAAGCKPHDRE